MEFTNQFTVDAPLPVVWTFLTNVQEVAPCVPGAEITEALDETHFKGVMKVKLGPVQITFQGAIEMHPDETARSITLIAKGQGLKGMGSASGTIVSRLTEAGSDATNVEIKSQVDVTGKVAQFGRGIMQDVAGRQIKQFAGCLEEKLKHVREAVPPTT